MINSTLIKFLKNIFIPNTFEKPHHRDIYREFWDTPYRCFKGEALSWEERNERGRETEWGIDKKTEESGCAHRAQLARRASNHFPRLHFHDWWSGSVSAAIGTGRPARFTPPRKCTCAYACRVRACMHACATHLWTRRMTRARANAGVNGNHCVDTTWCSTRSSSGAPLYTAWRLRRRSSRDKWNELARTHGTSASFREARQLARYKPGPAICRWLLITLNCSQTSDDRFQTYGIVRGNLTVTYTVIRGKIKILQQSFHYIYN